MGSPSKLVPVHNEPGAVQFKYDLITPSFSVSSCPSRSKFGLRLTLEHITDARKHIDLPTDRPDGGAEQDYLAFDTVDGHKLDASKGTDAAKGLVEVDTSLEEFIPLQQTATVLVTAAGEEMGKPEQLSTVPWLKSLKGIRSPLLRLHQEIVDLCRYLAPNADEEVQRAAAIDRVSDVVQSIWPSAQVKVFGSFATGLYLPTSDVDAVIVESGCSDIPAALKALAQSLMRKKMATNVQVIAKAKVPIIKFEEAESGYNFDISFDVANGPEAAENVRQLMDSLPPMRPLVMVLKVFLQQRELNEVYSGGLGSYALLVMVAAFLQMHPSRLPHTAAGGGQRFGSSSLQQAAAPLEDNLGVLLVDFLRLYGRTLNNEQAGVSCKRGGSFFSKRAKGFAQPERPYLLAVEDPNDPDNDLGKNSYNISRVRNAFDWAYTQLTAPSPLGSSLLQRVLRLDPVLFLRQPPPLPGAVDEGGREGRRAKKERRREGREGRKQKRREPEEGRGQEGAGGSGGKRHKHAHRSRHHQQKSAGGGGEQVQIRVTQSGARHVRFD